jgi:oligopeptidase B
VRLTRNATRTSILIGFVSGTLLVGQPPEPPIAPMIAHREMRHGSEVIDNYFWLREKSNPEVIRYLESENAYTEAMTKG